jgi:RNA recognition motif-containing protein
MPHPRHGGNFKILLDAEPPMNNYSDISISMQTMTSTKKLLIGNLPDSTQRSAVESLFRVVGPVISVNIVRNGFAFVEMTASDADKARVQLNGYRLNGRLLNIDEVRPPVSSRR